MAIRKVAVPWNGEAFTASRNHSILRNTAVVTFKKGDSNRAGYHIADTAEQGFHNLFCESWRETKGKLGSFDQNGPAPWTPVHRIVVTANTSPRNTPASEHVSTQRNKRLKAELLFRISSRLF